MAASILIADDDAVQRRLVENMVQKCGYLTIVVDSGDAAIATLTAPDAPVTPTTSLPPDFTASTLPRDHPYSPTKSAPEAVPLDRK